MLRSGGQVARASDRRRGEQAFFWFHGPSPRGCVGLCQEAFIACAQHSQTLLLLCVLLRVVSALRETTSYERRTLERVALRVCGRYVARLQVENLQAPASRRSCWLTSLTFIYLNTRQLYILMLSPTVCHELDVRGTGCDCSNTPPVSSMCQALLLASALGAHSRGNTRHCHF